MSTRSLTPDQLDHAAIIIAAWLGCSPDELAIAPATGGRSTPVYRVALGSLTTFLRLSETPDASLGPEALASEVLLSHGVRVPAVIGYQPFDPVLNRSLVLTTAIPGAALTEQTSTDPTPALIAAGAELARFQQAPVDGFGWIRRDNPLPTCLAAPHPAWESFAADLMSHPLDDWFDPPTLERITALAQIAPPAPHRAVLAHGDFDPSHIFAQDGRYTGIIDLGEIRGAEPTFDLGHLALHAPEALPSILRGFATLAPLSTEIDRQIAASALRIGWFRLTQSSARHNPPYAAVLVAGMIRIAGIY